MHIFPCWKVFYLSRGWAGGGFQLWRNNLGHLNVKHILISNNSTKCWEASGEEGWGKTNHQWCSWGLSVAVTRKTLRAQRIPCLSILWHWIFHHIWGLLHVIWLSLVKQRMNFRLLWPTSAIVKTYFFPPTNADQAVIQKSIILQPLWLLLCDVSLSTDTLYYLILLTLNRTFDPSMINNLITVICLLPHCWISWSCCLWTLYSSTK